MKNLAFLILALLSSHVPSTWADNFGEPPPRSCRGYLEKLNPVPALKNLYYSGALNRILHPFESLRRSNDAYADRADSEQNRRALAFEAQLASAATGPDTVPKHYDDRINRAMAISQGLEYHVVINSRRAFVMRDEGVLYFRRGWALFLDPQTKIVESAFGPNGEMDLASLRDSEDLL